MNTATWPIIDDDIARDMRRVAREMNRERLLLNELGNLSNLTCDAMSALEKEDTPAARLALAELREMDRLLGELIEHVRGPA